MEKLSIVVTGAAGFVGSTVTRALAADGHRVTALVRRLGSFTHPGVPTMAWDLAYPPRPDLRRELERIRPDVVVHTAALADDWASRAAALAVNRDGTARVAQVFARARLIHVSSSSVTDAFTPDVNAVEQAPARRFLSTYSESKAAAERALEGSNAVILRPHAVYGPGDRTLLPRVLDAVRRPGTRSAFLPLPEGGRVMHSLTHVDTLVEAIRLAVNEAREPGVYNVADAAPVMLRQVIDEFLDLRGMRARIVSLPFSTAWAAAGVAEAAAGLRGTRPTLTRYQVSQLGRQRTFDTTKALTLLGLSPRATSLSGAQDW